MTQTTENIIQKIERLLALAENNSSENEAAVAAAKAQELIAKYNIGLEQLGQQQERRIHISKYETGTGYKWKYSLSNIVARNFRCKSYMIDKRIVCFYGYEEDAQTAKRVFEFLFNMGNRLAAKHYNEYRKTHYYADGIKNQYLLGFVDGIKSVLDRQCVALMLVTPEKVEKSFVDFSKNFSKINTRLRTSNDADSYNAGKVAGERAMGHSLNA